MTKDTARASTQPAPLGKPGGPGLFHKKGQGLPVYIENIRNALMRKGMEEGRATATAISTVKRLALTSKDPAVKAAAAKAVLQWEKAKAASHVHASEPVELATPHDGHHQAGLVIYRYRHGWILLHPEVLSRGKHGGAHAATIHHKSGGTTVGHFEHGGAGGHGPTHAKFVPDRHLGPGEDYTPHLVAAKASIDHAPKDGELEAAQAHLDAQHQENLVKLKHAAQQAHLKAMEPFATSHMHQDAIDALGAVVDEAGPGHKDSIIAAKTALKHLQQLKLNTPSAQFKKSDAHVSAMAISEMAHDNPTAANHQKASLAHYNAMLKAQNLHADAWAAMHKETSEEHTQKAQKLISEENAPSYPKYDKIANDASAKANASGMKEDHLGAAGYHSMAAMKAKQGSQDYKKHTAAVQLHQLVAENSPSAVDSEDQKMAELFKAYQKTADFDAAKALGEANQKYESKHGYFWNAGTSPALGNEPKPTADNGSDGIGSGAEISHPGSKDYTDQFAGAKEAGFVGVPRSESANGDWKPAGDLEYGGMHEYSGSIYTAVNNKLRGKYQEDDDYYSDDADTVIAQADRQFIASPPLEKSIVVSRWLKTGSMFGPVPPGAQPGDEFTDPAYGSTSKDPRVWNTNMGAHVQVRIPAGMKALDLNHTTGSLNEQEAEVTLPRGTTYRVVSDTGQVPNRVIIVEVVAQDPKGSTGA